MAESRARATEDPVTATPSEDLHAWLVAVVRPLVERPEAVSARTEDLAGGVLLAAVAVDSGDVGRVVGRDGATILALQALARAFGFRRGREVVVALPQSRLGMRRGGT